MILYFSLIALVFFADLLTKTLIRSRVPAGGEIKVLPFFSITHVHNTGIAFGMFQNQNFLFLVIGVCILGFVGWTSFRMLQHDSFSARALALVVGGAFGNLVDRAYFGRVTDFLSLHAGGFYWPDFNVADSAICIGAGLLLWRGLFSPRSAPPRASLP